MRRDGFTLVELVIVLGIIAIVTHLAMNEALRHRNQNRRQLAARQIEQLESAFEAFRNDVGRYPIWRERKDGDGATIGYELSELWRRPDSIPRYDVVKASECEFASGEKDAIVDAKVFIERGWRGPYVRLPAGSDRLVDPWGHPIEVDSVASADEQALGVTVHGSDGIPDAIAAPRNAEERDCGFTNSGASASAVITFERKEASGGRRLSADGAASGRSVRVYTRSADDVAKLCVAKNTAGVQNEQAVALASLAAGPCVIAVYDNGTKDSPFIHSDTLKPGANSIKIPLWVEP